MEAIGSLIYLVITGVCAALGYRIITNKNELLDYFLICMVVSTGAVNTFSVFASYASSYIREVSFWDAMKLFYDNHFSIGTDFN